MTLKQILSFDIDKIKHESASYFVGTFITVIAMITAILGVYYIYMAREQYILADDIIRNGIDKAGVIIRGDDISDKAYADFLSLVSNDTDVEGIGSFSEKVVSDPDFLEILDALNVDASENELKCICINSKKAARLFRFDRLLASGSAPEDVSLNRGEKLVYLGWDFSNFYVGERFGNYTIAGSLEKHSQLFDGEVGEKKGMLPSSCGINLDDRIVIIGQEDSYSPINYFNVYKYDSYASDVKVKNIDIAVVADRLDKAAAFKKADVRVLSFREYLAETENADMAVKLITVSVVMFSYLLFSMISGQLLSLSDTKRTAGIMYSGGMSPKELALVFFFENVMRSLIIAVIAGVGFIKCLKYAGDYSSAYPFVVSIECRVGIRSVFFVVSATMVVSILVALIPVIWVFLHRPVDFLRGTDNGSVIWDRLAVISGMFFCALIYIVAGKLSGEVDTLFKTVMYIVYVYAVLNTLSAFRLMAGHLKKETAIRLSLGERRTSIAVLRFVKLMIMFVFPVIVIVCGFSLCGLSYDKYDSVVLGIPALTIVIYDMVSVYRTDVITEIKR